MDSFKTVCKRRLMQDMTKDKLLENSGKVCRLCDCHKQLRKHEEKDLFSAVSIYLLNKTEQHHDKN